MLLSTSGTFRRPSGNFQKVFRHCREWHSYNAKISRSLQLLVLWGLAGMMYSQTCPQGKEREGANKRLECNNSRDQNYTHAGDCIPPTQIWNDSWIQMFTILDLLFRSWCEASWCNYYYWKLWHSTKPCTHPSYSKTRTSHSTWWRRCY